MIEKAKKQFYQFIADTGPDKYNLKRHVPEVERWAIKLLTLYPSANKDVVLLAVWFHDIAHYLWKQEGDDHAVLGEKMLLKFCHKEKIDNKIAIASAHCVRSHRNKDIIPSTLEAKIVACADSASHMTGIVYMDMINRNSFDYILSKLNRDYRDIGLFPEIQSQLKNIYTDWKSLITNLMKID